MSTRQPNPPNLALGLAAPPLLASSLLLTTSSRSHISKIHNAFPAANESVDKRNSEDDSDSQLKDEARLGTGCSVLDDDVLLGGWRYGDGGVVGIACEEGRGDGGEGGGGVGDELAIHILTSHLLSSYPVPSDTTSTITSNLNTAYYIDPLGTFSPRRLHTLLRQRLLVQHKINPRLRHSGGYVYGDAMNFSKDDDKEAEKKVEKETDEAMDRVSVMRVFDFAGLMEAVGEVESVLVGRDTKGAGEGVEGLGDGVGAKEENTDADRPKEMVDNTRDAVRIDTTVDLAASVNQEQPSRAPKRKRLIIQDSQADGEEDSLSEFVLVHPHASFVQHADLHDHHHALPIPNDNDDDEEMLDVPSPTPSPRTSIPTTPPPPPPPHISISTPQHQPQLPAPTTLGSHKRPRTLLLMPSLPTLLSPLMRRNHITGHALLSHLGRSLSHLTHSHQVCVVVFNTTVGEWSASGGGSGGGGKMVEAERGEEARGGGRAATETPSVFAACNLRPALGRTWPFYLDVSVLVTLADKKRGGGNGVQGRGGRRKGRYVFEVLADRYQRRVGRWAVFEVGEAGGVGLGFDGRLKGVRAA